MGRLSVNVLYVPSDFVSVAHFHAMLYCTYIFIL